MKKLLVVVLFAALVGSAVFSFVGERRVLGDGLHEAAKLSRQAEFARFIHEVGFSDAQLHLINELVQETRSALKETSEESLRSMERAVEEAIDGDIEKSRQTEQEAREAILDARLHVREFVDSMRNIVTVAQQEKMFELARNSLWGYLGQNSSLAVENPREHFIKWDNTLVTQRRRDLQAFIPSIGNTQVRYLMTEVAGRNVRDINIPEVFDRVPMDKLYEVLPDNAKERIRDALKDSFGRLQRRIVQVGQRGMPSFEEICLTFLVEDNAEVIRRIVED